MRLLRFKCRYRTTAIISSFTHHIDLFLPCWQQSKRALLLAGFLCASVPAQANIFDPLLRVLIPTYESDNNTTNNTTNSDTPNKENDRPNSTHDRQGDDSNTRHPQFELPAASPQTTADAASKAPTLNINIDTYKENTAKKDTAKTDTSKKHTSGTETFEINSFENDKPMRSVQDASEDSNQENLSTDRRESESSSIKDSHASEPSLYALLDAEFAIDRGDLARGLEIYKQQAFKKDATPVFERALALSLGYDDTQSSLEFATAWHLQHPDHVPAWFYVAHLALKAHDYNLAGETLSRILRYDPRADLSEILVGIYPTKEQDQRDLLATLQPLDSTHNASLSVLKAGLLLKFNEPKAALLHVNQALKLQPTNVPVITLKADILRKLDDAEVVLAFIEQSRLRLPNRKSLYLYEIRYRLELKQSRQAWQLLLDAHNRFTSDAEITLLAALVSLDIEEYAQANRLLNTLAKNPHYLDQAYYYLGVSAERQHRFEEAKGYFNAVMQEDLVLSARKKVVAFELIDNDVEGAIATLRKLRAQFDVFAPDSYIMQADILRQQGAEQEARDLLAAASQRYPDNEALLFARAQLLDDKDDFIIKRTLLNHLLAIAPDELAYQLDYAELLLANDPNAKEGLALAQAIIEVSYDDPRYNRERHLDALNLLASSALANQQFTKVIDYLQTPYQVMPTLRSGELLLRAYQGLGNEAAVAEMLEDLQRRFAFGQQNVNDSIQLY